MLAKCSQPPRGSSFRVMILTTLQQGHGRIAERVRFRFKHRRVLHVGVVRRGSVREVAGQHRSGRCRRLDIADRDRAGNGGTGLQGAVRLLEIAWLKIW